MASSQSADEVKQKFLDSFPGKSGELAHWLWSDIAHLHMNWANYRRLFGPDEETIDLLNSIASSYFSMTERILRHDTILRFCRITDPPFSDRARKKPNASLEQLHFKLSNDLPPELVSNIRTVLDEIKEQSQPVRALRNKRIAHSDFNVVLQLQADPLPGVSRQQIEDVLLLLRKCFSLFEEHFRKSTTAFEHVIQSNDSRKLLFHLKQAQKYSAIEKIVIDTRFV